MKNRGWFGWLPLLAMLMLLGWLLRDLTVEQWYELFQAALGFFGLIGGIVLAVFFGILRGMNRRK